MTNGFATMTFYDYDGEPSTVKVRQEVLDAANFDAQAALRGAFESAVVTMTEVSPVNAFSYGNENSGDQSGADSPYAQREMRWQVNYIDANGDPGHFSVFCPKTSLLNPNARKYAYIGDGDVVDDFVTNSEAFVLSKAGEAITIQNIELKRGGK